MSDIRATAAMLTAKYCSPQPMLNSIKAARNEDPNEDGRWINLPHPVEAPKGWTASADAVNEWVPEGHFLVAISRELKE